MTTAGDIIDLIQQGLHGYGASQDRVTGLAADMSPTDMTFTVTDTFGQAVGISPGLVEIDSEQIYVKGVDQATGRCTIPGFGRGMHATTPSAHSAGALITTRPAFPRAELLTSINDVIGAVYPDLFAVKDYTTVVHWPSNTYAIPNIPDGAKVLDAQWQDPLGNWVKCNSYTLDPFDQTFRLGSGALIGRPLRIVYMCEPTLLTSEADDFALTGLPSSCSDVIRLGVIAAQASTLDIARAQIKSAEQSDRSKVVPPFAGEKASQYAEAMFQQRLQNEARALRIRYKTRMVRTF
jgi:hypothetical protein